MMMRKNFFTEGKLLFQVLLILVCNSSCTIGHFNLYDTDRRFQINPLQFDCLNYYSQREILAYQDLFDVVDETIPYCVRPLNGSHKSFEAFDESRYQKLYFKELRCINISVQQLISWSVAMEVIERYQAYLNAPDATKNEYFYNCTPPRFGLRCQYFFKFSQELSFNEIVKLTFDEREPYSELSNMIVHVPCYVLLKCHRNGQPWCLDWREICDGTVDCFDEGTDEQSCFDLEINECHDDEFRCHNGLCISKELWEDGEGETDCLDRTDGTISKMAYIKFCFRDVTFLCEEHSCRPDIISTFSCGDGQCVSKFQSCSNGRHVLRRNWITALGNLTDDCWNAMACLTSLVKNVNKTSCDLWLMHNSTGEKALEQCGSFFPFPTVPVHSNHIYFFYEHHYLNVGMRQFLVPHYVCYNEKLCDGIIPDLVRENQTCSNVSKLLSPWGYRMNSWYQIMLVIEHYLRSCSMFHDILDEKTKYSDYPSLYKCRHSGKLISKHRIMDEMPDCLDNEDEFYANSCQLNDPYRVTCIDTTKCWSPLVKSRACVLNNFGLINRIQFQTFCNGVREYFYDDNRQRQSDESGCGNWSCDNMYTRCDGFWACKDGRDEYNCIKTNCSSQEYPCMFRLNYTVGCLPSQCVNDSYDDCIGALDEQINCREKIISKNIAVPFTCLGKTRCLQISQICNKERDCPEGDDEDENLCKNRSFLCSKDITYYNNDVEELFCEVNAIENRRIIYFSVHTSFNYPLLERNRVDLFKYLPAQRSSIRNFSLPQVPKNKWPWSCHRGLTTFIWLTDNNSNNSVCMCPPSYYGHQCQYQSQRLSLTLRLTSNDRYATYAIVSMLIDDTDRRKQIHAYDHSIFIAKQSCSMKLNRYLLFQSRPKDISRNYSVRIDVYEKNAMAYVGTWQFPISFLFLPVNRLSVAFSLSNHHLQQSSHCSNNCIYGECIKYVNKNIYFCRCFPKWSGAACDIPVDCQACSSSSICIGSANNRPICVCPIDSYGRQCLFRSKCSFNACQHNGQCISADVSIPGSRYTCICADRYFGTNCEHRKAQLDVSLNNMDTPPYLIAYFFTLSNQSNPVETIILRKLTLFQRTVTFYIAVPFQLVLIHADRKHYLAVLQQIPRTYIATSISPQQECLPAQQLFNSTVMQMTAFQRIIHFHWFCYMNSSVTCFMDETYFCLCTNDHLANCMEFNHFRNFTCPLNSYCMNDGQCLQDHPHCPLAKICVCRDCFFGNQCQFYAKAFGLTLDEILGYEFQHNRSFAKQSIRVFTTAGLTVLIFLIGIINSILAIITFSRSKAREVGCGKYLLASSITSLLTMIMLIFKFCFLFYSHQDHKYIRQIEQGNCFVIEILLKLLLYLDNWLNACVALERIISTLKGIAFNKRHSRIIANRAIFFLLLMITCLFIPQFIYLHIYYDDIEIRSWCVVRYIKWLSIYSSVVIFIHYFVPLAINLVSIICVVLITARQRSLIQNNRSIWMHLRSRIRKYKHILGSSMIIVILTLPNLIGSIVINCRKSSDLFWFYLTSYFLSFLPAASSFFIFVLPSSLYKREFVDILMYARRRIEICRLNISRL